MIIALPRLASHPRIINQMLGPNKFIICKIVGVCQVHELGEVGEQLTLKFRGKWLSQACIIVLR